MEKYKIAKDSVQETLIIPLYGRWLCWLDWDETRFL